MNISKETMYCTQLINIANRGKKKTERTMFEKCSNDVSRTSSSISHICNKNMWITRMPINVGTHPT